MFAEPSPKSRLALPGTGISAAVRGASGRRRRRRPLQRGLQSANRTESR